MKVPPSLKIVNLSLESNILLHLYFLVLFWNYKKCLDSIMGSCVLLPKRSIFCCFYYALVDGLSFPHIVCHIHIVSFSFSLGVYLQIEIEGRLCFNNFWNFVIYYGGINGTPLRVPLPEEWGNYSVHVPHN